MRRWLLIAVLGTVIIPTVPRLVSLLRLAGELHALPVNARRERLMPDTYAAIEKIRSEVPASERIGLVGVSRESADEALFVNYYIYPHPTRTFHNRWELLSARDQPKTLVRLDTLKRTTYADLRNDEVRRSLIVRDMQLPPAARTAFAIPIVTSTDGPPPVVYTIEGALAADREAHVTLTLEPANVVKTLTISSMRTFHDLVYECFGVMQFVAWVDVKSDAPVRAAFWLVNRAARTAAPIHLTDGPLTRPAPFPPQESTANLWLLNLGDDYTIAHVGPDNALVAPRSLLGTHANGTVTGRVYAFISKKQPNGQTQFIWPEDLK